MKKIIIAIDGFSACGKSTTAKGAARALNYTFIDSGAMYRACTLYFLENEIDISNQLEILKALDAIDLKFVLNLEKQHSDIWLNGRNVEEQIRQMNVSKYVSEVSKIQSIRKKMVAQQRKMGLQKGIIMDGRDIGTNVFPDAELKFFLTADIDVRVKRRSLEMENNGIAVDLEEVKENLLKRDRIDQERNEDPLRQAEDAILMDTSNMSIEDQINVVVNKSKLIIEGR